MPHRRPLGEEFSNGPFRRTFNALICNRTEKSQDELSVNQGNLKESFPGFPDFSRGGGRKHGYDHIKDQILYPCSTRKFYANKGKGERRITLHAVEIPSHMGGD